MNAIPHLHPIDTTSLRETVERVERLTKAPPFCAHNDCEIDIKLDVTLHVQCDRVESEHATRSTPGVNGGMVPHTVWYGDVDITKSLSEEQMDAITQKCNADADDE